jgi:DNA-binding MarR family transcriptional regulator
MSGKSVQLISEWFPGKKVIKCLLPRKALVLGFNDRLAYSWLVYRAKYGRGASQSQLAAATGLHRTKTIPRLITRLLGMGLVERRGRKVFAKEPSPDHFVYAAGHKKQDDPWYKRLAYFCLMSPSVHCPLTLKQVAVLCLLFSPNMRDVAPRRKHLATLLRISEKTVRTALHKLEEVGCLKDGQLLLPTPDKQTWWEDRPKQEKIATIHCDQEPSWENYSNTLHQLVEALDAYNCEDWKGTINRIGRTFQQAGYPFEEASNILVGAVNDLRKTNKIARLVLNTAALVKKAEDRTAYYRSQGQFHGATSFGLFKKMLRNEVKRLKES